MLEHLKDTINFKVKGAIFDVDDTLLDNKPGNPGFGLHERARLAAARLASATTSRRWSGCLSRTISMLFSPRQCIRSKLPSGTSFV
ncbi:MAG TPA: hypothetical protein VHT70_00810 [Candidatus Saccharimonadales bacterium]|jgi:hypothetical protein|nr:hypothetical protein [Candidatus Saccharimonadales bacterium]